jgi:SAM-dependent methyltransferase
VSLPLPPLEMRQLVGPTEEPLFDNPGGGPVFAHLQPADFEAVLDFGCGCGRLARQLIQQRPRPQRYLGIDLHLGMIQWCQRNLQPHASGFEFRHHDAFSLGLNPMGSKAPLPFPAGRAEFSLVLAWSVFTHVNQEQAEFYLREAARVLRPDGVLLATFFLFDKGEFPMMQSFQNALFINETDPSNAVIFDRAWLLAEAQAAGLTLAHAEAPRTRGYQWLLHLRPSRPGLEGVELPPDGAPRGRRPPPLMPADAERLGRD